MFSPCRHVPPCSLPVDLSLLEAVQLYQREAVARLAVVSETNLKAFSEFFFADYLRHFRLYQLTLTRRRACAVRRVDVDVAVPTPSREAFASSKPLTIWQYEQQLVAMEQERQQALEQRRQQRAQRMAHDGEAIAAMDDRGHKLSTPFNREVRHLVVSCGWWICIRSKSVIHRAVTRQWFYRRAHLGSVALTVGSVLCGTILNCVSFIGHYRGQPIQQPIKMT